MPRECVEEVLKLHEIPCHVVFESAGACRGASRWCKNPIPEIEIPWADRLRSVHIDKALREKLDNCWRDNLAQFDKALTSRKAWQIWPKQKVEPDVVIDLVLKNEDEAHELLEVPESPVIPHRNARQVHPVLFILRESKKNARGAHGLDVGRPAVWCQVIPAE